MKCINKAGALRKYIFAGFLHFFILFCLTGCVSLPYSAEYGSLGNSSLTDENSDLALKAPAFSSQIAVYTGDIGINELSDLESCASAVLFDVENKEVIYSKNAFDKLYPASLTKIMTALVAIKHGQMDQILTATDNVRIDETGAQKAGITAGDSMTLYTALRIMLLYSANDVSMLIAENIGGTVDNFISMMNDEAIQLGATGTHFTNPHGLTNEEHYTTAYDLYLIFNECIKYDEFREIISMPSYDAVYTDKKGNDVFLSVKNTNGYMNGSYTAPAGVSVIGGKTGTTSAAGNCLILLSENESGNQFISVVLKSEGTENLYENMNSLLDSIE